MAKAKLKAKESEKLGRRAMAMGWPFSLHDERLKRSGIEVKTKDPETDGYWDWWPEFRDELTEKACEIWLEQVVVAKLYHPEVKISSSPDGAKVHVVTFLSLKGIGTYWLDGARGFAASTRAEACLDTIEAIMNLEPFVEKESRAEALLDAIEENMRLEAVAKENSNDRK